MFVQEAEGVAEFVKNGAAIVGAEGGAEVVDPAEIHRRLFGFDAGVLPADIAPRTRLGVKSNTNIATAIDWLERDVGVLGPFRDGRRDFVLTNVLAVEFGAKEAVR